MSSTSKKEQAGSEGGLRRISGWTLVASAAVLVGFTANRTDVDDVTWSRLAWLLSSVDAIAFGAAGAIFGASVQKDRAVAAERRAGRSPPPTRTWIWRGGCFRTSSIPTLEHTIEQT